MVGDGWWVMGMLALYLVLNSQTGFDMHDPMAGERHLDKSAYVLVAPIVNQPDSVLVFAYNIK